MKLTFIFVCVLISIVRLQAADLPLVIGTWNFANATAAAWSRLQSAGTAVDAIVSGCSVCEDEQCDGTVGFGGSPDENGETTLDAMIMDGATYDVGAVANLHSVRNAIGVAHAVMKHMTHTLLVGNLATNFAREMGFPLSNLSTGHSIQLWESWKANNCQPNYWQNVVPDPKANCGPYVPPSSSYARQTVPAQSSKNAPNRMKREAKITQFNHDTIGMVAIDGNNNIAGGTSTNGANHKIPGRVGDSPIVGSGAYAVNGVGGAAATGDGDIMMRFLPSFSAVELMKDGTPPYYAALAVIQRISRVFPTVSAAVIAANAAGEYGAACHGFSSFAFTVMSPAFTEVQTVDVSYI